MTGPDELRRRYLRPARRDEIARRVQTESPRAPDARAEQPSERQLARFPRPARQQHGHRDPFQSPRHVPQPAQRRRVAPVKVIRDEQYRLLLSDRRQQPIQPEHDGRRVRGPPAALTQHRLRRPRGAPEPSVRAQARPPRREELPYQPEAQFTLQLAAGAVQYTQPVGLRHSRPQQRRLADPEHALQHQHPALTPARAIEQPGDLDQLALALYQPRAHLLILPPGEQVTRPPAPWATSHGCRRGSVCPSVSGRRVPARRRA
jgi:hypothetical protein